MPNTRGLRTQGDGNGRPGAAARQRRRRRVLCQERVVAVEGRGARCDTWTAYACPTVGTAPVSVLGG